MKRILTFVAVFFALNSFGQTPNSTKKVIEPSTSPLETGQATSNDSIPAKEVTPIRNTRVVKMEGKQLKPHPQPISPNTTVAPTSKKVD